MVKAAIFMNKELSDSALEDIIGGAGAPSKQKIYVTCKKCALYRVLVGEDEQNRMAGNPCPNCGEIGSLQFSRG
jgi:hypothetical protein